MKKNLIKLLAIMMMLTTLWFTNALGLINITDPVLVEAAGKPKLNKAKATIGTNETFNLSLKNNSKKVKWSTNNKKAVSIKKLSNNKVRIKAKKAGKAKVLAKVGKKKYACVVTVKTVTLSKQSITLTEGESYTLKLSGTKSKPNWSIASKDVASLKKVSTYQYKVTAKKAGETYIKVRASDNVYKCKVIVKKKETQTTSNSSKYTYKISIVNNSTFNLYNDNAVAFYIQTNNPDRDSIIIKSSSNGYHATTYNDVRYHNYDNVYSDVMPVLGGYLSVLEFNTMGSHTFIVEEKVGSGYLASTINVGNMKVAINDYSKGEEAWCQKVLSEVTTSSMSDKEKMDVLCDYILDNFKYHANDGTYLLNLLSLNGAYWETKRIDCLEATAIMRLFASKLGLKSESTYAGYLNHYYATVWIDGVAYVFDACPSSDTGFLSGWAYVI